jgi:hypothetical protein
MFKFFITLSLIFLPLWGGMQKNSANNLLKPNYIVLDSKNNLDYVPYNININEQLSQPQRKLVEDTLYMQVFMLGTMAVLVALPESISNWDLDELQEKSLSQRWKEHVEAGPVWDKDDFFINYIGHPVSGAWYYTMARNDGCDPFESFLYSSFISTFVWEYGYEAFAEIPSIQDLFATPIVGSFLGEYFHYLEIKLDKNKGEVLGSKTLGNISYFFLDPIGKVTHELSDFFDVSVTMKIQAYNSVINKEYQTYNEYIVQKPVEFYEPNYTLVTNFIF